MHGRIIELNNVWKTYKLGDTTVNALQNVSLKVPHDDFLMILGPSGSGKSTLMHLLGALDVPSQGNILLENHNVSNLSQSQLAQIRGKKIGFVFQQFNLVPILDAIQNVSMPMMFQEVPYEEREERAKQLLTSVGLANRMYHKPTELSGGEQQRVAIARALANNPDMILADEPTGNLDSKTGVQIMDMIIKLHTEQKKTIIMVTHDQSLVKHAHRVIYIKDGQIIKEVKMRYHD